MATLQENINMVVSNAVDAFGTSCKYEMLLMLDQMVKERILSYEEYFKYRDLMNEKIEKEKRRFCQN